MAQHTVSQRAFLVHKARPTTAPQPDMVIREKRKLSSNNPFQNVNVGWVMAAMNGRSCVMQKPTRP